MDVFFVINEVVGVDQDVIKVNEHTYVQEVGENIVQKMLECSWGIGSLGLYMPGSHQMGGGIHL